MHYLFPDKAKLFVRRGLVLSSLTYASLPKELTFSKIGFFTDSMIFT